VRAGVASALFRSTASAVVGAVLAVGLVACGPARERPDVVVVTVDTLRADRLGAYGQPVARTPHIDALAGRSVRFEHATVPRPRTTPSLGTLLTGLWPHHHGARGSGIPLVRGPTLGEVLAPLGYETLGVSASRVAGPKEKLDRGFAHFVTKDQLEHWRADSVSRSAIDLAVRVPGNKPLFLWVHYIDPHWPYDPGARFAPGPEADPCRELNQARERGELSRNAIQNDEGGVSARVLDACTLLYDAEIATTDAAIGALLAGLERAGRLRNAYLVFTSDHGENLGEGGSFYQHGVNVHDAGLRVPLLIAGPDVVPGVDEGAFRMVDVAPTLLGLLGVRPDPPFGGDGVDLSARVRGRASRGRDDGPLAFATSASPEPRERTARTPRFKLVDQRTPEGGRVRVLFDLTSDPGETHDVSAAHPEVVRELGAQLDAWSAQVPGFDETADLDADQRERLRALGYID